MLFFIIWLLSFLYFFIPAFVTYFKRGSITKKVVAGIIVLLLQSLLVASSGLVSGTHVESRNVLIVAYAVGMSAIGIAAAAFSSLVDKRKKKAHS